MAAVPMRARSGVFVFLGVASLAGCAALVGIDDRTLDTADASVAMADEGGNGDQGPVGEEATADVGSDAESGAVIAEASSDTQGDRTVQAGPDAASGDARGDGDAQGAGDVQARGDARGIL